MMAPDSQRVIEVFGSSMAGTRPLGLMDSKGSACVVYLAKYSGFR